MQAVVAMCNKVFAGNSILALSERAEVAVQTRCCWRREVGLPLRAEERADTEKDCREGGGGEGEEEGEQ